MKNRIAGSNIPPYEIKITAKNGEIKCLKLNGNRIINQGKTLDLAIFHDVTDANKIQKKLRQDLVESEEKFRSITNSIKEAIITVDQQAKVTYWNQCAEDIFGYLSKEAIGKSVHELVVPNSTYKKGKERIEKSVKTFSQTGLGYFTVGNVELVGRHKNGKEFPAELSISPVKLSGKLNAVGVVKDITNRKQNEQKLRESELRYHTLFDQSPLGVLVIDPETTAFVEFNDIAHQQLGYLREEFEEKNLCDIEANESSDELRFNFKEMAQNGGGELETQQRTKNGEVRDVKVITRAFQCKGKTYLHCIFHDVTKSKEAEKALKESEELSRAVVTNAPIGIATSDPSYHFISANDAFGRILGYSEDELRKLTFKQITHPEDLADSIQKINDLQAGKIQSFQIEKRYIKKDGTTLVGKVITNAIRDQAGLPTLFIAELEDITKSKQLEYDLRSSEERFRAISTSAMDAIILSGEDDRVIYWNPAAGKTFGFTEKEAVGRKLAELVIPPHGQISHKLLLKELMNNQLSKRHFGFSALRNDGTIFPMDLTVASVKLNNKKCLLSIVRDVTEWKALEETLRRERDMLEDITKNIGAGLVIIDKDYRILWSNNFLKNLNGDLLNKICFSTFNTLNKICPGCGPKKIFEGASFDSREYFNQTLHDKGLPCWF